MVKSVFVPFAFWLFFGLFGFVVTTLRFLCNNIVIAFA
jgi:hypothetical protein